MEQLITFKIMKIKKPTMKQGELLLDLNQVIVEFKVCQTTELKNFLDEFYHVDTYFKEESLDNANACYRVQGHISFNDMPLYIPKEFTESQFDMVEKHGELVFEVWAMNIYKELPF
jgi:hypothetical protein